MPLAPVSAQEDRGASADRTAAIAFGGSLQDNEYPGEQQIGVLSIHMALKVRHCRELLATVAAPVQPALAALQANGFLLGKRIVRRVEGAAVSLHRDAVAHLRADRQKLI